MKCPLQNANTTAYSIYIVKGAYYRVLKAVAKIKAYSFFCVSVSETRQVERIKSYESKIMSQSHTVAISVYVCTCPCTFKETQRSEKDYID